MIEDNIITDPRSVASIHYFFVLKDIANFCTSDLIEMCVSQMRSKENILLMKMDVLNMVWCYTICFAEWIYRLQVTYVQDNNFMTSCVLFVCKRSEWCCQVSDRYSCRWWLIMKIQLIPSAAECVSILSTAERNHTWYSHNGTKICIYMLLGFKISF